MWLTARAADGPTFLCGFVHLGQAHGAELNQVSFAGRAGIEYRSARFVLAFRLAHGQFLELLNRFIPRLTIRLMVLAS